MVLLKRVCVYVVKGVCGKYVVKGVCVCGCVCDSMCVCVMWFAKGVR